MTLYINMFDNQHWMIVFGYISLLATYTAAVEEYCQSETFDPQCSSEGVIVVEEATFGRMRIGKCVDEDFGHLGCSVSVKGHIDAACSGKSECLFPVLQLEHHSPCPKSLKPYLEVIYKCIKVTTPENIPCTPGSPISLNHQFGYLASITARETGCGLLKSPWKIKVHPGQRVHIILTDFADDSSNISKKRCRPLGFIVETGHMSNFTICNTNMESDEVYVSNGRSISIHILPRKENDIQSEFLLHYEVRGCADFEISDSVWYKRHGDIVNVGCEKQDLSWEVKCEGNKWTGSIGNCSDTSPRTEEMSSGIFEEANDLTFLVLIIIGAGLVIVIAVCVALIIIKCRRRDPAPPSSAVLLDKDYRHSIHGQPNMSADDSHYRSLLQYQAAQSQTMPRPVPGNPQMNPQFSTMHSDRRPFQMPPQLQHEAHDSQVDYKGDYYTPNYFVLDQDYVNKSDA